MFSKDNFSPPPPSPPEKILVRPLLPSMHSINDHCNCIHFITASQLYYGVRSPPKFMLYSISFNLQAILNNNNNNNNNNNLPIYIALIYMCWSIALYIHMFKRKQKYITVRIKKTKLQTIKMLLKKIGFKSRFKTVKWRCLTKLH